MTITFNSVTRLASNELHFKNNLETILISGRNSSQPLSKTLIFSWIGMDLHGSDFKFIANSYEWSS